MFIIRSRSNPFMFFSHKTYYNCKLAEGLVYINSANGVLNDLNGTSSIVIHT